MTRFTLQAIKKMRAAALFTALLMVSACTSTNGITKMPSENYNSRVSIVVIHFTVGNFKSSAHVLTKASSSPVSSHYLVPEPNDPSYTKKKLEVFELVPEDKRAWHAGVSYWGGKTELNDHSIGIEIVNQPHCETLAAPVQGSVAPKRMCFYPDFAENQIDLVIDLVQGILARHPRVSAVNIIGHSDIAPARKIDPGPRFPWQRLYQVGIGAWPDDEAVTKYWNQFTARPIPIKNVQQALHAYGYGIEQTGILDEQTRNVLSAFQMHFRPFEVTGEPTPETTAIIFALIEKYKPTQLEELLTTNPQ